MVDFSKRNLLAGSAAFVGSSLLSPHKLFAQTEAINTAQVNDGVVVPDKAMLATILNEFGAAAKEQSRLKSAVVSLNGKTVFAESFRGPPVSQAVNIKSVSKSVVATLLGIAKHRSVIRSFDQTIGELTPGFIPSNADPRVADITLNHLVTMRAGLQRTSGPAYGRWVNSKHWIEHVLSRPFVDQPGGQMLYSTGDTHVLGAILSELTGSSLYKLANNWIGKPIGITFDPWTRDPQGYYLGGNEMSLSPLHLAKLGELYLNNGNINGTQVFGADWAEDAFTPRTQSVFSGDGYGYGWFLRSMAGEPAAYARGYGGQVLHILPTLSLAVAITSDTSQRARSHGYMTVLHELVTDKLVSPMIKT